MPIATDGSGMRIGIISVFTDHHRRGAHHRGVLQPQVGPLIAALLPPDAEVDLVNDAWDEPDWSRDYDLLFLSCLHSDFDRARQISHYWRRRGAKTVLGGVLASTYPDLCTPYFDAIVVGDPEATVPVLYADFQRNRLQPRYVSPPYDPASIPSPRYDLAAPTQVLPIGIEATRGCPFTCDFCALTGAGIRHLSRPAHSVVRDILAARRAVGRSAPWHKRNVAIFYDNNLGGNFNHLRGLCDALAPLRLYWGACVTFNVLRDENLLARLSRAGCRALFVGLESFNPAAIRDMGKHQNLLREVRAGIARCHDQGMLLFAGLMLSPREDDLSYIAGIPRHLRESGLHVPAYVSFETPFPGTPHFHRLALETAPAFLPNALLRDFNGYTLVTRPLRAEPEAFVAVYRDLLEVLFSPSARLIKFAKDAAHFLPRGRLMPLLYDLYELASESPRIAPGRSLIAGTDLPPPEYGRIPFCDGDFSNEAERNDLLQPLRVTDAQGRVLPQWLSARHAGAASGTSAKARAVGA